MISHASRVGSQDSRRPNEVFQLEAHQDVERLISSLALSDQKGRSIADPDKIEYPLTLVLKTAEM